ncbi:MAG: hypothetical protein V1857_05875 [archaeon]
MSDDKFETDLDALVSRLVPEKNGPIFGKLVTVRMKLVEMRKQNLVKINHSTMEVVCAKDLILRGYDVDVEHSVDGLLVCDLFGVKGDGRALVEIETGFVPPEHALDPTSFFSARVASKIARYSAFADKFSLASPLYGVLPIPTLFLKPPRSRSREEIEQVKKLCDRYYENPPVAVEDISAARIQSILMIDVDSGSLKEFDPETYGESMLTFFGNARN